MNTYDPRIDELFSTITDLNHVQNINREAFNDISQVLLSFHDIDFDLVTKTVCDASMGHGKSSVLISYLKWITRQQIKQPLLVAIKEKQLAHDIFSQVSRVAPNSIINIDSDNKNLYESDLNNYQIVIIQHQRLKNFALGFGNVYDYQYFSTNKAAWGTSNQTEKVKRKLIIDEKPDFVDSVIFDINSVNNVLDWFEDLAEPLTVLSPAKLQYLKSYIIMLLGEQLAENLTDKTLSLFTNNDLNSIRGKNLLTTLKEMQEHEQNKNKYDSLNKLKHFKKLLKTDSYGRIDDYDYHKIGRKIIVSKLIDYSNLDMHLLVFDGTARATGLQYVKLNFEWEKVTNRNDYSRLHIHIDSINTSKYSRSKEGKPTQKAIAKRIRELKLQHEQLFVLPTKDEINLYLSEYAIKETDKHLYYDNEINHTKGINILNTTGKNFLKDYNSLYLTCLPKKNADYYKCLAIAFHDDLSNLLTNSDTNSGDWFKDSKLELIYKHDLYAEILQIIHRTALRKIDSKEPIHIYIAYDEDKERYNEDGYIITPISTFLNEVYLNKQVNIDYHTLTDMSLYGRDKKIEGFATQIINKLDQQQINELSIGKVSNTFSKYIRNNWSSKDNEINNHLQVYGLKVIEKKDRYSNNSKYVIKI